MSDAGVPADARSGRSIVTHGGDSGETGLLYGGRVPKDDLHTEAYGSLDILSDPDGAPAYDKLKAAAGGKADVEGESILVASLDHLIAMKETSGRTKDKLMATEYRVLSDELRAPKN